MTFNRPFILYLLWLLPLVPLLFRWGDRARLTGLRHFGLPEKEHSKKRRFFFRELLLLGSLGCLILALGGPQYGYRWEDTPGRGRDLLIALDCSKSMYAQDMPPSRMVGAQREIKDLLPFLQGERVGLAAFSGSAFLQCPLTADFSGFALFLDSLDPSRMPRGGTNLEEALRVSLEALPEQPGRSQAILLVTDAEDTEGDPRPFLEEARRRDIPVFALGVGTSRGSTIPDPSRRGAPVRDASGNPVISRVNLPLLREMADLTGGKAILSVPGDEDIKALVRSVRGTLETTEFAATPRKVPIDRYQWFAGASLLALLLFLVLPKMPSKVFRKRRAEPRKTFLSAWFLAVLGFSFCSFPAHAEEERLSPEQELPRLLERQIEHPTDPRLAYNMGNAYYRMGRFEEAARSYESLFDGETPWEEMPREFAGAGWYNRGNALYRLGKLEEAAESYRRALEMIPRDDEARKNLAFVLRLLEQQQQQREEQEQENQKQEDGKEKKDSGENSRNGPDSEDSSEQSSGESSEKEAPSGENREKRKGAEQEDGKGDGRENHAEESGESQAPKSSGNGSESSSKKEPSSSESSSGLSPEGSPESLKEPRGPSPASPEKTTSPKDHEKALPEGMPGESKEPEDTAGKASPFETGEESSENREESSRAFQALPSEDAHPQSGDLLELPPPLEREVSRKEDPPELQNLRAASEDVSPPSAASSSSEESIAPDMMEHLLHRLRDMPGEALIPRGMYEAVEKDW